MVADIARKAAIKQALDPGFALGEGEAMALTSNTDEKVTIYSMQDGEPRPVLKIHAEGLLNTMLANGQPAFWYPGLPGQAPEYKLGTIKCFLHPDFDEKDGPAKFDRAWVDSLGLMGRTCNMMAPDKNNRGDFRSVFDRDDHMQKKHRREWAIIQAGLERERREREETERRADREAMIALATRATAPQPPQEAAQPAHTASADGGATCDVEGCNYAGTHANVNRHKAMAHRE